VEGNPKWRTPVRKFIYIYARSFYELFRSDLLEYFANLEMMTKTQLKGIAWRFDNLDDDEILFPMFLDQVTIHETVSFNITIKDYPGSTPWGGHIIDSIQQIDCLPSLKLVKKSNLLDTFRKTEWLRSILE
jgi:hypothetical protein